MVIFNLTDCPTGLRGDLTKWLLEVSSGVFVGQISSRVKDELWTKVKENCKNGRAVLVFTTNNEQRMDFRIHGETWEPIDYDGIKLILRPSTARLKEWAEKNKDKQTHGFSDASKIRSAKRFANLQSSYPNNYVIIDLETTGLNPETDEIIEIAAIKTVGHEKTDVYNKLVSISKPLSPEIIKLTGITDAMLKDEGVPLTDALGGLIDFIGDQPLIGHNIDFDKGFLLKSCAAFGFPMIVNRSVDTLKLAKRYVKDYGSYKLEALKDKFGFKQNESHRGLNDCETTGQLYRKLMDLMKS